MIQLTPQEAGDLKDAIRAERVAREQLDIATAKLRVTLLETTSKRWAVFEALGDKYNFDSSLPHDLDWINATLTPKTQG